MPWAALSAFELTYGSALAKAGFHRVTTVAGEAADIGGGSTQAFLWYKTSDTDHIAELAVLYDSDEPDEGWEVVARDITKGQGRSTRLAFRRMTPEEAAACDPDAPVGEGKDAEDENDGGPRPVGDIKVVLGDEPELPEGYVLLDRALNVTGAPVRFAYRLADEQDETWTARSLDVGDWLDVLDEANKWCVAQVVSATDDTITVHFKGWGDQFNDTLDRASSKLAEHGTHTAGKDTGSSLRRQGAKLSLSEEDIEAVSARLAGVGEASAAERDRFLRGDLPQFVEQCLSSTFSNQAVLAPLQDLLRQILSFIIASLRQSDGEGLGPEVFKLWAQLFNADTRCTFYYKTYGIGAAAYRLEPAVCEGDEGNGESYAVSTAASRLFMGNVNFFGRHGGFDALLERMDSLSFSDIAASVQTLGAPRFYYDAEFKQTFFQSFQERALARLASLSDAELKDLDHDALDGLLVDLENLLSYTLSAAPVAVDELLERFQLTLSKRLLVCKSMSKQVKGVSLLSDLIQMTLRKDARKYSSHSTVSYGGARSTTYSTSNPYYSGSAAGSATTAASRKYALAKWLTPAFLSTWILESRVVDILLGDEDALREHELGQLHAELLKRSGEVLKFLAKYDRLEAEHLDLLWRSARGSDENATAAMGILGDLCAKLSLAQLLLIYQRIQELPVASFSVATCALVQEFVDCAVLRADKESDDNDNDNDHDWFGLDLLWQAMLGVADERVARRAQEGLSALLSRVHCRPRVAHYLDQCFANIQARQAVEPSIALAKLLIGSLRDARYQVVQLGTMLRALDDKFSVVPMLIAELREAPADGVDCRLDFLLFVLKSFGDASVSFEQVSELWDAVYPSSPEKWMKWLVKTAPNVYRAPGSTISNMLFGDAVSGEVFSRLLGSDERMGFATMTPAAYACFERYFREINGNSRALAYASAQTTFIVDNIDLAGLEALWGMVLKAGDADVAKTASEFLINLYVKVGARLDKRQVWGGFVEKCMEHVTASVGRANDAAAQRVLERVMTLVVEFLNSVEKSGKAQVVGPDSMRIALYKRSPSPAAYVNVIVRKTCTLHELREEAALTFGHPADRVRLQRYGQQPLNASTNGDQTAYALRIYSLDVHLLRDPAPDTQGHKKASGGSAGSEMDEERRYPREVLSNNPEYFALLFRLLAETPVIVERAWHLLQLLPRNEEMDQAMKSFGGSWPQLLDPDLPLKLLYQMQIAQGIALRTEGSAAELEAAKQWSDAFVSRGGFDHLYGILMSADLNALCAGPLTKACLALQLQLVMHFLLDDEGGVTAPAVVDQRALVERLLHVMTSVARSVPADGGAHLVEHKRAVRAPKVRDVGTGTSTSTSTAVAEPVVEEQLPISTEAEVVRNANHLLVAAILADPSLLEVVFAFPSMADSLLFSVLHTPEASVRAEVADGVVRICSTTSAVGASQFFLGVLLPAIDSVAQHPKCREFFGLLVSLVERASSLPGTTPEQLGQKIVAAIMARPVVEVTEEDEDHVLRGLLVLLRALLASPLGGGEQLLAIASDVIEDVFSEGLFAVPTAEARAAGGVPPPKLKHADSRAAGFALLTQLARGSADNLRLVAELAGPYHTLCPTAQQRAKRRGNKRVRTFAKSHRSTTGYVGMKNLGCICYMISTLQQFFMVPGFRAGILAAEDQETDAENSVLYQLQYMFAFLQESEKQYYNPKPFCAAFKTWEGEPTDVSIQQDASEFLTMFLQQIENSIQGTASDGVLREFFGGTYANELVAPGGHYSERLEAFNFMSVNVKDLSNLYEALDQFIQAESVTYTWEDEEKGTKEQLETDKSVCIKTLPETLVVHLKRFDFDFDALAQVKINDRFEFPKELDMYRFTKDGRPSATQEGEGAGGGEGEEGKGPQEEEGEGGGSDDSKEERPRSYYVYELSGVVVHTGTANSGHYYSFIRERDTPEGKDPRWFEFNDDSVTEWDIEDLDDECYGGESTVSSSTYSTSTTSYSTSASAHSFKKYHNAFMLVYDRKKVAVAPPAAPPAASEGESKALRRQSSRGSMQPRIFDAIWEENTDFWLRKNVYDEANYDFLGHLAGLAEADDVNRLAENLPLLKLVTEFACGTLASAGEPELMETWMQLLRTSYARNLDACSWLLGRLACSTENLRDQLLEEEEMDSRKALVGFYSEVLKTVAEQTRPPTGYVPPPVDTGDQFLDAASAAASSSRPPEVRFVDALVSLLPVSKLHWRRWAQFFDLLGSWARVGAEERGYLLDCGVLTIATQLLLGERSPAPEHAATLQRATSSDSMNGDASWTDAGIVGPDFTPLVQLVSQLATSRSVPDAEVAPPSAQAPQSAVPDLEWSLLCCEAFFARIAKECHTPLRMRAIAPLLTHLCWQSNDRTLLLLTAIEAGIDREDHGTVSPFIKAAGMLMRIEDELATSRRDETMTTLMEALRRNNKYILVTEKSIEQLLRLAGKNELVWQWLCDNSGEWAWMEQWLTTHRGTSMTTYRAGYYTYKTGSAYGTGYSSTVGKKKDMSAVLLPIIGNLKAREPLGLTGYDSDDEPELVVGRRIMVDWGKGKKYPATIVSYSPTTKKHHVKFDDDDEKDYALHEKKNFKMIPP